MDVPGHGLVLGLRQGRAGTLPPGAALAAGPRPARAGVLPRPGRAQAHRRRLPQPRPGQPARQEHPPDPGRRPPPVHRHRDAPRPRPALAHRPRGPALQLRTADHRLRQHEVAEMRNAIAGLTPAERRRVLEDWNDTVRDIPGATVPELFEAQVARTPDAPAVIFEGTRVSYAELNRRANRLARH